MSNTGDHFHTHRNLIGFDENGVPTVLYHGEGEHHTHVDEDGHEFTHFHEADFTSDYMKAVSEYRKTFPDKAKVLETTPDPAVRDMILRMEQIGIPTVFDRFDTQVPQCSFGLAGTCCKNCNMGPCKITQKSPYGVCGADADLIVARNMLRSVAGGVAQHGMHARELILSLKWAAEGKLNLPILGGNKIKAVAKQFGIKTEKKSIKKITIDLCNILLDDLQRSEPGEYRTISAMASKERQEVWKKLNILPISAYNEVFDALHRTGVGTDGDWKSIMEEFLRCGLAFTYTGVVAANIATDGLFGVGDRVTSKTNLGALKKDYVNIAVHGHLPTMVSAIVRIGRSEEYQKKAREAGAKGLEFYGICCTGLSAMYRDFNVIPISNAVSAELALCTGAIDLWVADVQDVYPAIMNVADCFQTRVVTTTDHARLPGATRIEFDHHHSNIADLEKMARQILDMAIAQHKSRTGINVYIPPYEVEAEVGFSVEYVHKHFGSMSPLAKALKSGKIKGIVNMVGCNNPKVPYERTIIDVADVLLENDILILTNGCASYPLMKLGYCKKDAYTKASKNLREFLEAEGLPPVWHVGECIDNTRSTGILGGIAGALGIDVKNMPYAFSSPEMGNEKAIGAALGFRLNGISSYHCVENATFGSANVTHFLKEGTRHTLGSVQVVDVNPKRLGQRIVDDISTKRKALGWDMDRIEKNIIEEAALLK